MSNNCNMTANDKRNAIINLLCLRRSEKVKNLMFEFGVSRRTILNDITILTCSYPVETIQGRGGCVKIADWYRQGNNHLSSFQREALLHAIKTADDATRPGLESIFKEFS